MNPRRSDDEVEFEFVPFCRIYKSGRKERILESDFLPAGLDHESRAFSKDVVIDAKTGVSARLYLPMDTSGNKQLPVLIYYHGGGFCIATPFSATYHTYLNSLVSKANVVAVSIDYRRLPDHPLPAAYDDSWSALTWVASKADPWLTVHGDFSRVFMAGDSAGANIVHHMAMRVGTDGLPNRVTILGIAMVHSFFWGSKLVGSEIREKESDVKVERMWRFCCPTTTGVDDPLINPMSEAAPSLAGLACERVLVSVAEKDMLMERGMAYYEKLKGSEWSGEVEFYETEGEDHVFHLLKPTCHEAFAKMERMVAFLNRE